jgi:dephospho-CoA kinase
VVIIGIGGTNGAGKDTVAQLLAEKYGFLFVGATEMFTEELRIRNWPADREHKAKLSAEWRRELGMAAIVDKALAVYNSYPEGRYKGLAVGSLRHPGEADRIHELGGLMLWVDADPKIRYARVTTANRGRGLEDDKSFEEFLADEQREMTPAGDAATLNMSAVKERADRILTNNYSGIDELSQAVAKVIDFPDEHI